jgi:predicted nucleic acid-binding Zn ribbon protein
MQRGPEPLGEILSRLFTARGWGRRGERLQLEEAWLSVVGAENARTTRLGMIRRGVLEVTVGNSVLMQELAHFHKKRMLQELRKKLPSITLSDIRFRAGVVQNSR